MDRVAQQGKNGTVEKVRIRSAETRARSVGKQWNGKRGSEGRKEPWRKRGAGSAAVKEKANRGRRERTIMDANEKRAVPEKAKRNYVGYEYKEVAADGDMAALLLDGYESFGWEINDSLPDGGVTRQAAGGHKTILRLRRDRKILNKAELTRLQRNFEACVAQIQILEGRKTAAATAAAIILGVIGTAFIAGSVFAVTAEQPYYVLSTLLAIPGFLGWIFPYVLYKKMVQKQTVKLTPLIEAKYDEIYEICEKGSKLLY